MTTATFQPRRLGHVNLFVSDLRASLAHYRQVCGFALVFDEPGIGAVFLSNGNSHHDLALMQTTAGERTGRDGHVQVEQGRGSVPGLNHLGFEMENEAQLVAAVEAAQDRGVEVYRTVDHQISHSAYLWDPDGNYLEFYADAVSDFMAVYHQAEGQLLSSRWSPDPARADTSRRYVQQPVATVVAAAPIHPLRISQAALVVRDLAGLSEFYTEALGFVVRPGPDDESVVLVGSLGQPDLVLLQQRGHQPLGLHHFVAEVADEGELEDGRRRLTATGRPVAPTGRLVIADPDGITLEIGAAVAAAPLPR